MPLSDTLNSRQRCRVVAIGTVPRAYKQLGPGAAVRGVDPARPVRPRSVEARRRDLVRHRLRHAQARRLDRPASRRRRPHLIAPPLVLRARRRDRGRFGDALAAARRRARCRSGCLPRADAVAARAHRARALRPCVSLAARAAVHRLRRACGIAHISSRPRSACSPPTLSPCTRFALALRRPVAGGALLGLAAGLAFLCRGPLGPALIALTALLLPLFAPWRKRALRPDAGDRDWPWRLPLLAAWPLALYLRAPALFAQWYDAPGPRALLRRRRPARRRSSRFTTSRICPGSRGRRCRSRSGRSGCAAEAYNGRLTRAGHRAAGDDARA